MLVEQGFPFPRLAQAPADNADAKPGRRPRLNKPESAVDASCFALVQIDGAVRAAAVAALDLLQDAAHICLYVGVGFATRDNGNADAVAVSVTQRHNAHGDFVETYIAVGVYHGCKTSGAILRMEQIL